MQHISNVLVPMACFIQLPPLIGFRSRGETVGVDGAVRTVCLAGLVGVVGGNFGEMVLLVGVGWLVLRLCFGLFLLRGSWSGVGSLYLISTLWPGS